MKRFLNEDMQKFSNISDKEKNELKEAFKKTVSIVKSLLLISAFSICIRLHI